MREVVRTPMINRYALAACKLRESRRDDLAGCRIFVHENDVDAFAHEFVTMMGLAAEASQVRLLLEAGQSSIVGIPIEVKKAEFYGEWVR